MTTDPVAPAPTDEAKAPTITTGPKPSGKLTDDPGDASPIGTSAEVFTPVAVDLHPLTVVLPS